MNSGAVRTRILLHRPVIRAVGNRRMMLVALIVWVAGSPTLSATPKIASPWRHTLTGGVILSSRVPDGRQGFGF